MAAGRILMPSAKWKWDTSRYSVWGARVDEIITKYQPQVIFVEDVMRHIGVYAAHLYGAQRVLLGITADRHGVPVIGVPVGSVKKHATGKGNAKKPDMIAAANKEFGKELVRNVHDIADALWIVRTGVDQGLGPRYNKRGVRIL
jgi:Holliday junction resolvasome RuvABC endonuclease subunit